MLIMEHCTNCGAALEPTDKFCTSCGNKIEVEPAPVSTPEPKVTPKPEPTPVSSDSEVKTEVQNEVKPEPKPTVDTEAVNARVDQTKKYAQDYFGWFKNSCIEPFEFTELNDSFYGITTFVLAAIIGGLGIVVPGHQIYNMSFGAVSASLGTGHVNPFTIGKFFTVTITFAIVFAIYVAVGFAILKMAQQKETNITFTNYVNRFAHFVNYTLVVAVVALLVTLLFVLPAFKSGMDSMSFAVKVTAFLLMIVGIGFNIGFLAPFLDRQAHFKIDRIYVAVIAQIVGIAVMYFVMKTIGSYNGQGSMTDLFSMIGY
jgi:uncharacterized Zn finger protein (UPF0148 family)